MAVASTIFYLDSFTLLSLLIPHLLFMHTGLPVSIFRRSTISALDAKYEFFVVSYRIYCRPS